MRNLISFYEGHIKMSYQLKTIFLFDLLRIFRLPKIREILLQKLSGKRAIFVTICHLE